MKLLVCAYALMALSERYVMQYGSFDLLACSKNDNGQPVLIRMRYTSSENAEIRAQGQEYASMVPGWLKDRQRTLGEIEARIRITPQVQRRVRNGYAGDEGFISIHS